MGDTGSLTIGIILSALAINLCSFDTPNISYSSCGVSEDSGVNAAVAAFSPLLVPCLDVVRVYLHRIRNHRSPFLPDKNHIHHKLLALGIKPRQAMLGIIAFSLLLSVANILLSQYIGITVLFIADIILFAILNILISKLISKRQKNLAYMNRILDAMRRDSKKTRLLRFEEKLIPMIDHLKGRRDASDGFFAEFYDILRLIDYFALVGDDLRQKYTYVVIAKSTLSEEQLIGLFYHVLNRRDARHFQDLIEKYAVFGDLRLEDLRSELEFNHYQNLLNDVEPDNTGIPLKTYKKSAFVFELP